MRCLAWVLAVATGCGSGGPKLPIVDAQLFDSSGNDTPAAPAVFVAPMVADFGAIAIGTHSAPVRFTITNTGGSATDVAAFTGGDFTLDTTTCTGTLGVGATCIADVACAPQTAGLKTGALSITTTNIVAMATAQLTCAAVTADNIITVSPAVHGFGDVPVGQVSAPVTFTFTNVSPNTYSALVVTSGGMDPTQFSLASDTCTGTALVPAASCTTSVAFAPTTTGAKQASYDVSATGAATVSVAVTGTGI